MSQHSDEHSDLDEHSESKASALRSEEHPKLGREYTVVDVDWDHAFARPGTNVVPVGYDDQGNLRIEYFDDEAGLESKCILWNDDAFVEHVSDGSIVEGPEDV